MKLGRIDVRTDEGYAQFEKEIEERRQSKRDFLSDTRRMRFEFLDPADDRHFIDTAAMVNMRTETMSAPPPALRPVLDLGSNHTGRLVFGLSNHAQSQIAQTVQIPKKYYDRMLSDAPDLLAANVNTWFNREPKMRMVRTMYGGARAFLSDRYRQIENEHVLAAIGPALRDAGAFIESAEVTESRFYLKAIYKERTAEVKAGDVIEIGICIRNSEIGMGAIDVQPFVNRLVCSNGMVINDAAFRRAHVGKLIDGNEYETKEIYRDDTRIIIDEAFRRMLRDTVAASAEETFMDRQVDKLRAASEEKITTKDIVAATVCLQERTGINDEARQGILYHLINGGDLSKYGLANAITRYSQDVDDYDAATDLEALGGQVIELPKNHWRMIAEGRAVKKRVALAQS